MTASSQSQSQGSSPAKTTTYEVHHRTTYTYEETVSIAHHLTRLAPRQTAHQTCEWHEVTVEPEPVTQAHHFDYFGNAVTFFAISGVHRHLTVVSRSRVIVAASSAPTESPPWETVRDAVRSNLLTTDAEAGEFSFNSPLIKASPAVRGICPQILHSRPPHFGRRPRPELPHPPRVCL